MKNEQIEEMLKSIVQKQKIVNRLYVRRSAERHGNFAFAKKFAKMILCEDRTGLDRCKSCLMFEDGNHTDYYEINKDRQESIKIDEIRELQGKILEKPITSLKKVYIINNAENMTKEAQNSFLKTLEEPPEFATIILVINNENTILPTIKSRCTKILFTEENVEDFTEEEKERYSALERIFGNVDKYLSVDLLGKVDTLYNDKENVFENLDFINMIFKEKAREDLKYLDYIDIVENTKQKLKQNSNFDMCIDFLILNIWENKA